MTARKARPVANLAQTRKEQAAARKGEAQSRQRHPAGKQMPQKPAAKPAAKPTPAKAAKPAKPAKPVEAQKVTYQAQSRSGKTNTRQSATPPVASLDVRIGGRKGAQWQAGVIVQMYASLDAAEKAAAAINAGEAGPEWTDAVVVPVKSVAKAASRWPRWRWQWSA